MEGRVDEITQLHKNSHTGPGPKVSAFFIRQHLSNNRQLQKNLVSKYFVSVLCFYYYYFFFVAVDR